MKKILSKLVSSVLALSMIPAMPVYAENVNSGKCGDNASWKYDGNGKLTISGSGKMYDAIDSWNSFSNNITEIEVKSGITYIGVHEFDRLENLKIVSLPNTINQIGDCAFSMCINLEEIKLPDSITSIGSYTFEGCNLKEIVLPQKLSSISDGLFSSCFDLSNIIIPDTITEIGHDAFGGCTSLKTIQLPSNLTSIGEFAFDSSGLTQIVLPESLQDIENCAFVECNNIKSITIPKNVRIIGDIEGGKIFSQNTKIDVSHDNSYFVSENGILFDKNRTTLIHYPIDNSVKEYIIPDSVKKIYPCAFLGATNLEKVQIPNKISVINDSTFANCTNLVELDFPESVTEIKTAVFYGCSNLNSIIIRNPQCVISDPYWESTFKDFQGTIYGYPNSIVQKYANDNGIKFKLIDDLNTTTTSTATTSTATSVVTTTQPVTTHPLGDVNGDDIVDGRDATAILTYYAKTSTGYTGTLEDFIKSQPE